LSTHRPTWPPSAVWNLKGWLAQLKFLGKHTAFSCAGAAQCIILAFRDRQEPLRPRCRPANGVCLWSSSILRAVYDKSSGEPISTERFQSEGRLAPAWCGSTTEKLCRKRSRLCSADARRFRRACWHLFFPGCKAQSPVFVAAPATRHSAPPGRSSQGSFDEPFFVGCATKTAPNASEVFSSS